MPIEWPTGSSSPPSVDGSDDSVSYPSSEASFDSDDQHALIQEEWEESMRQLEMVVSVILLPFLGKWWGRKFAFWGEFHRRRRRRRTLLACGISDGKPSRNPTATAARPLRLSDMLPQLTLPPAFDRYRTLGWTRQFFGLAVTY